MTEIQRHYGRGGLVRNPASVFQPEEKLGAESFRRLLAHWFFVAAQCRYGLALSESPTQEQRAQISDLIAFGEWAQLIAERNETDLSPIGVTVDDLKAETRILRDTVRSAFDNCLTDAEGEEVLNEVFG